MFRMSRGVRLSPIIQIGHLTGYMPTDEVSSPWGVQTDIVERGGSSGSPIVDPADGTVVGIAQNVIAAEIEGRTESLYLSNRSLAIDGIPIAGRALMGLVYDISNHHFSDISKRIKEEQAGGRL